MSEAVSNALLEDRGVVRISGADAYILLQGLVTVDLDRLKAAPSAFGALLAPQGKIQFDFIIYRDDEALLIDIDRDHIASFMKRMGMYKLRSDVTLEDVSADHAVLVAWTSVDGASATLEGPPDPRYPGLGTRAIVPKTSATNATSNDYHRHRISLGIPEAGKDFAFNDIFPHDGMLDVLNGVDFQKGCYVGQEVVSRVQHRSTARKRFFIVEANDQTVSLGTDLRLDEKLVGQSGKAYGDQVLALLRVDKVGTDPAKVTIDGREVSARLPDYFTRHPANQKSA